MSNDAYIDSSIPTDAWWAQMDEDEQYQACFEAKEARAKGVMFDALKANDQKIKQAFGWMAMLVVELQDEVKHLNRSKS